jgi:serine/threonine-protein kinase
LSVREKKFLAELPYKAPEQVEAGAFVDHLADLYNLGAVVYALLTGKPPFTGTSPQDTIHRIKTAPVVKPSKTMRGIPTRFEAAVIKLLSKKQEERYQTGAELLADLMPAVRENGVSV